MNSWLFVAWPRYQLYFKNKKTVRTLMTALKWSLYKRRIWKTTRYFFSKRNMKVQHRIEVLLWSSNPVFNVGGGQARGGNEISNLEHKTGKLWPGKKEIMKRLGKCFLFTSSITYQRGVPQCCFSLGVLWRNRLVLKGGPHQGREIPKDIPLQGLTNEYKINALWRRDNTAAVF